MRKNLFIKLNDQKGMTLLEIMIVLAILGGLITILAGQVTSRLAAARVKEARIQIAEIGKALDMFYTDCGFYPEAGLSDLVNAPSNCPNWGPDPYLKKIPKDPWGNEFEYEYDNGSYILVSYGEDRKPGGDGTSKDISSEEL
ncbi:MAG: type II secretion system major pseudopilin GspG [Bdellovibrionales bacterium]|nr:type II secretion system major pseudopilin GspG [Bdellovibrionales bacterium]